MKLDNIKLDIGCGWKYKTSKPLGWTCIDIFDYGQGIIHDVRKGLNCETDSADEIRSEDFLEHLTNDEAIAFLNECWRVLKPDGKCHMIVPSVDEHPGAFVLQHKSYWNETTFRDLGKGNRWKVYKIRVWDIKNVFTKKNYIHCVMSPKGKNDN